VITEFSDISKTAKSVLEAKDFVDKVKKLLKL